MILACIAQLSLQFTVCRQTLAGEMVNILHQRRESVLCLVEICLHVRDIKQIGILAVKVQWQEADPWVLIWYF